MSYSAREKELCAKREAQYRRRVYSRMVTEGRMKANDAEYQINLMQAIADDYHALAAADEPQLNLKGNSE